MLKINISIEGEQGQNLGEFSAPSAEIAYEKLLKFEAVMNRESLEEHDDTINF